METLWYRAGNLMTGLAVQRFQEHAEVVIDDPQWLETHGTKAGNDGYFGKDSDKLARLVQDKLGLYVDGVVGENTWKAIYKHLDLSDPTEPKVYTADNGVKVIDGREIWTPVKKFGGTYRPWTGDDKNRIRGVMLHQTGCWMPEKVSTWKTINAHCGITREGTLILMFDFSMLIWHGNDLTRPTIGIEVGGLFEGLEGHSNTVWPKGAKTYEFNEAQLKATDTLFDVIKAEFEKHGGTWEVVYAHRQSHDWRMSDPGETIWKQVGIPWIKKLGATDGGKDFCVGSGHPIPEEWNPEYVGNKFWAG